MTFAEEWAQIKHQVSTGSGMTLDGTDASSANAFGGGGAGGVKSKRSAWTKAAHGVGELGGNAKKALTTLEDGQGDMGGGKGVLSAAAQKRVYHSWHRYLEGVSGRCNAIKGLLEKASTAHSTNDQGIQSGFDKLAKRYADTSATGGTTDGK